MTPKRQAELNFWKQEAISCGFCQDAYYARRYVEDCGVSSEAFAGMKVLDVGCGPYPCLMSFEDCERHGLDSLLSEYKQHGYPMDNPGFTWHEGCAEAMPFEDASFDAVVCVNALDHFDDLEKVALEIRRVLRPGGKLLIHAHYHPPTITEPIVLDDETMWRLFGWAEGLTGRRTTSKDCGRSSCPPGQVFAVWTNLC